jgi:SET domain-containing protein
VLLKVARSPLHGHGCFATRDVKAGEVVARGRLLIFPPEETEHLFRTNLRNYLFYVRDGASEDPPYYTALAMGPMSFCNHAEDPTCDFSIDEAAAEMTLTARRPIAEGDEVTISYGDYAEEIV